MSVLKFIDLTGESPESWAQAARVAIDTASQTLRRLRHAEVTRLTIRIGEDGEMIYQSTIKLAFHIERADEDESLALQQAVEIVTEEPLA